MFQFGRFPCRSLGMTKFEPRRVSPFGHLRLLRSYTPHRSFSQYNTSFIGTRRLGIHCVPLLAFRTIVRSRRLSWHALTGITFALIIQFLRRTEPSARDDSPDAHSYYRVISPVSSLENESQNEPNDLEINQEQRQIGSYSRHVNTRASAASSLCFQSCLGCRMMLVQILKRQTASRNARLCASQRKRSSAARRKAS